jgi:choline-sulfatase
VPLAAVAAASIGFFILRSSRSAPPNIVLITLDTTRADHLGAYGYGQAKTPRLDRLAGDGVLFEHAVTSAPITLPAHASLLTGSNPFAHGVRNNGNFSLDESIPTLATRLHDAGYRTAAFVSSFVLDRRYGLARGFDSYDDRLQLERRGDVTAAAALEWLRSGSSASRSATASVERQHAPFFLWLHLYDAHDPYAPPPPFREAFASQPYDGEIAFDDQVIGSVLDELDRLSARSTTIVAVVGDHGESLGEHDEATHAVFVYEATLRVPLIVAWPGHLPNARRVADLVRGIDLAPTLLDLAGAQPLTGAQGRSLAAIALGQNGGPVPVAYAETYFPLFYMNWAPLRSVQDGRWKYIEAPQPELYDLGSDPGERINLVNRESGRAAALRRTLEATAAGQGRMSQRRLDRDAAAKLAALGYVGGSASHPPADSAALPDPKKMIGVFNTLRLANAALSDHRPADAAAIARAALAADSSNAFATIVLANASFEQGAYRDAIDRYRDYLSLIPASVDAHQRMAICYSRLGDVDRALDETAAALAIDPRAGDAHNLRGGLLASRGKNDEAIRELQSAVEIDPDNAPFHVGFARVLISARRLDTADREIQAALQLQPANPDAHAARAALLTARGRAAEAVAEYERALTLRPEADDVRLDFARTLERVGRSADARKEYERLAMGRDTPTDIRREARARLR